MESEAELIARSLAGDHQGFARLIAPQQAVALRVAYTIAGSDAEDVVQDAFVKAYTRLGQFRAGAGAGFRPWVLAIVANEARNRRRGSGRREGLALRAAGPRAVPGPGADPEDAAVAAEARAALVLALSTLPDRDREIVALRYFAELSEAETAAALGCPVGTVKSRLARALARLRAQLATEAQP
jgi:RNA polymerase sigma factor (sigma-70 family)